MENKNNVSVDGGDDKKRVLFFSIVAVVIILFVIFLMGNKGSNDTNTTEDQTVNTQTEDTSTTDGVVPKVPSISYANALVKYKDLRIQLDEDCQAFPNNVTYKNGTYIMIDNRAPVARTFKIGTNYTVKAYGFRIIKLSSATLPITWLVDCDKYQNVATILLQK